jgi:hypothetical protein
MATVTWRPCVVLRLGSGLVGLWMGVFAVVSIVSAAVDPVGGRLGAANRRPDGCCGGRLLLGYVPRFPNRGRWRADRAESCKRDAHPVGGHRRLCSWLLRHPDHPSGWVVGQRERVQKPNYARWFKLESRARQRRSRDTAACRVGRVVERLTPTGHGFFGGAQMPEPGNLLGRRRAQNVSAGDQQIWAATPPEPALATCLPACAGSACPRARYA